MFIYVRYWGLSGHPMSAFLVRDSQFLPIWDRKADITYEEILLRRSNWLECLISDPEADLGHGPCEWPLLADSRHWSFQGSRRDQRSKRRSTGGCSDILGLRDQAPVTRVGRRTAHSPASEARDPRPERRDQGPEAMGSGSIVLSAHSCASIRVVPLNC